MWPTAPISQRPTQPPSTMPRALAAIRAPPAASLPPMPLKRSARYVISRVEPNCINKLAR